MKKTNVMRVLDRHKIAYETHEYEITDGKTDGVTVASKIGKDPQMVFKTLVTQGTSKNHYVFVVPVGVELDLKKAAHVAGEKKIEMIMMKDLLPLTGYIHGGCSPIGMKKQFKTFIDESANSHECLICSAGKIGAQIELRVVDLIGLMDASLVSLT